MRTAVLVLLTAALGMFSNHAAFGQDSPQVRATTCDWFWFLGNQQTLDGQGYIVGDVSNARITVIEETNNVNVISTNFQFDFSFYNGSGTYGGSQSMFIDLKNANGTVLETVRVGVPRGRCLYDHPYPFFTRGRLQHNYCNLYKSGGSAELRINRVSGTQRPC